MAKQDFCFTFYDGDATRDMHHMTRLERGAYTDVIIQQRQRGHLSLDDLKKFLNKDFKLVWKALEWVLEKDEEGKYFIEWLEQSIKKSVAHAKKQKENISKRYQNPTKTLPKVDLEAPLVNENGDEKKGVQGEKQIFYWQTEVNLFFSDTTWIEKFCKEKSINKNQLELLMKEFHADLDLKEDYKDIKELKKHFTNWFNKTKPVVKKEPVLVKHNDIKAIAILNSTDKTKL